MKRLNREQGLRGRGMGGKTNIAMLGELRQLAGDRGKWRDIISAVLKLDSFDCDYTVVCLWFLRYVQCGVMTCYI